MTCSTPDEAQCSGGPTPAPEPLSPREKIDIVFCFGVHTTWGCGDFILAFWLAIAALFIVEFVFIPIHAARDACVKRTPYCQALRHAWLHQCWCFARIPCCGVRVFRRCSRRAEPVLADENGNVVPYYDWLTARAANDRLLLENAESANAINTPLLCDASRTELEEAMRTMMAREILRDASPSDLEAALASVQANRARVATAPAGLQIMDITDEAGAAEEVEEEKTEEPAGEGAMGVD